MGIINATPDSFSGDGVLEKPIDEVVNQAIQFVKDGADIIDIGGESTRPGSQPLSVNEELKRVIPIIKAVRDVVDVPISVDTYKSRVAEEALKVGANWVNDVWGLKMDRKMAEVVVKYECPVIIMHNRSKPKNVAKEEKLGSRFVGIEYENLIEDIIRELEESIEIAHRYGIKDENIIIDPGIGFGKTVEQNLQIINELYKFKRLGYPILAGPSRKSFIGYTLDLPPYDRIEGTAASVAILIDRGANIIRVHDVKAMVRVARMTDAIVKGNYTNNLKGTQSPNKRMIGSDSTAA